MLDWLIVGGGPHGVHMAACLLARGHDPAQVRILDPHPEPLARWRHYTGNTGMRHLRSPAVHNLDPDPLALRPHASDASYLAVKRSRGEDDREPDFVPPYSRPSLQLFMHHSRSVIDKSGLLRCWQLGRATSIRAIEHGYHVRTCDGGRLEAENVVLALGVGEQLHRPDWANPYGTEGFPSGLPHIFSPDFRREDVDDTHEVVIVGGGISAVQLALSLLETNSTRRISIVCRHHPRKDDFDSDPGWLGPLFLNKFHKETDYCERRRMIQEARNVGTLASEVVHSLELALQKGALQWVLAEIAGVSSIENKRVLLVQRYELDETEYHKTGQIISRLGRETHRLESDVVILATGFEARRPGGSFVDEAVRSMKLPTARDGFPILGADLSWRDGLFVTGPLAELEVGPAARNLSGAQTAAERIVESPRLMSRTASP